MKQPAFYIAFGVETDAPIPDEVVDAAIDAAQDSCKALGVTLDHIVFDAPRPDPGVFAYNVTARVYARD